MFSTFLTVISVQMQRLCPFILLHLAVNFTYVIHDLQRS
jgi:hypothetical protein